MNKNIIVFPSSDDCTAADIYIYLAPEELSFGEALCFAENKMKEAVKLIAAGDYENMHRALDHVFTGCEGWETATWGQTGDWGIALQNAQYELDNCDDDFEA